MNVRTGLYFVFTLLAGIVPFTSSMTSNLLRSLHTLFSLDLSRRRFYAFMASPKLPWNHLWQVLWSQIPEPAVGQPVGLNAVWLQIHAERSTALIGLVK